MAKGHRKPKPKEGGRRRKKKVSVLTQEGIGYVDWKDINLLRRFMSDRAKIRARQVTGNDQQQQKEIARAIKNAREMALLPYNNRITTQRSPSRSRDDGRIDGPVPQPSVPPPGMRPSGEADGDEFDPGEAMGDAAAMGDATAMGDAMGDAAAMGDATAMGAPVDQGAEAPAEAPEAAPEAPEAAAEPPAPEEAAEALGEEETAS